MSTAVSIICPYRDAAAFLPGLIANVRLQSHPDWELLLIDDGSLDAGPDLARSAARGDQRIRLLRAPARPSASPQLGPWWPRNVGLAKASHGLIAFLDVDDRWHPAKLQRQIQCQVAVGAQISVTGYARFEFGGDKLISWRLPPPRFGYSRLRCGNAIPMLTVMLERRLLQEGFLPCPHEDYLRWLSLFRDQPELRCITIPELLAFYAVHGSNLTGRRWQMPLWTYRVYRAHGMGAVASAVSLLPWGLTQAMAQWSCRRRPLSQTLQAALQAEHPWPLPPAGSS